MEHLSEKGPGKVNHRLKKEERLCSKKMIEKLFAEGSSRLVYPLKVVAVSIDFPGEYPAKTVFTVSKKRYKKAVARNLLKRRMREAYRLNKHLLFPLDAGSKKAVIFIYVGKEIMPYRPIERAMIRALGMLKQNPIPSP